MPLGKGEPIRPKLMVEKFSYVNLYNNIIKPDQQQPQHPTCNLQMYKELCKRQSYLKKNVKYIIGNET